MEYKALEAIVAVYSDWGLGCEGTQPVVVSEDRRHFANLTKGAAIIVGRKTMEDFPNGKPLANRHNIVLTRSKAEIEGAFTAYSLASALMEASKYERVFVVGGASLYNAMLPGLDRIYVTKVEAMPKSDVFLPNLDESSEWRCTEKGERLCSENGVHYCFCVYERILPYGDELGYSF